MKPVISVIIPAYDEGDYIKDTLISLKNQDFDSPYEIIVCDNNSKDKTVEIAKKYADKVVFEKKQGGGYARNKGASVSRGKYFVFTDADTVFPRNYLKEAYKIFKQDKWVAFTGGAKLGALKNKTLANRIKKYLDDKFADFWNAFNRYIPGYNFCISRKWFKISGGFPGEFPEDHLMSKKVAKLGKIQFFTHFPAYTSTRRTEEIPILWLSLKCVIKLLSGFKYVPRYSQPWKK